MILGDHGSILNQRSIRWMPILPPDCIRRLLFGIDIVLLRTGSPIITDPYAWSKQQLVDDRAWIEDLLRHG